MNPDINRCITIFNNWLNRCAIFDPPGNIQFAVQAGPTRKGEPIAHIGRGLDEREVKKLKFNDKKLASDPLYIKRGGEFKFFIRLNASQSPMMEKYSFRFIGLRKSKNGVHSLRFDKDLNRPRGRNGWDGDFEDDAPSHPIHHLHINFEDDNDMRLPTGAIDPLMIIASIDYWYRNILYE